MIIIAGTERWNQLRANKEREREREREREMARDFYLKNPTPPVDLFERETEHLYKEA